jgi:hypothetical protein
MISGGIRVAVLCAIAACAAAQPGPVEWKPLFDGKTLNGWRETPFSRHGAASAANGAIVLAAGSPLSGVTWTGEFPKANYEIRYEARRIEGGDFFASLTFPVGDEYATFVTGGWGGDVIGLSSIDGLDASENETNSTFGFDTNRWYEFRIRVTSDRIVGWIDSDEVFNVALSGRKIGLRPGEIRLSAPLGLASYGTRAEIRRVEYRRLP